MIDKKTKKEVRRIMRADKEQIDSIINKYPRISAWVNKCYNRPQTTEIKMEICNEILGGYGIEALDGKFVNSFWQNCNALYVNTGDTYDETLIFDTVKEKFHFGSWGDMVEMNPKRFE